MELRIQWFGMGWAISVLVAALAAGFLVLLARRYGKLGHRTGLFQVAAAIEVAVLVLDVLLRVGASGLADNTADHSTSYGLRVLDAWTLFRPLAHAAVLMLVAIGMRRLVKIKAEPPPSDQPE